MGGRSDSRALVARICAWALRLTLGSLLVFIGLDVGAEEGYRRRRHSRVSEVNPESAPRSQYGAFHALLIGIQYKGSDWPPELASPENDVYELATRLEDRFGFEPEIFLEFLDSGLRE